MRDIRRFCLVRFFRDLRLFFAISKPSEWLSIGIDIQGRLGNGGPGGEAKAVLECSGEI
jgi:hypothetical protein